MTEYESFDEVAKQLEIDDDDLKQLVSEGSLRAYRDENDMKFRKEDVESVRRSKSLSDLGSQPTLETSELDFVGEESKLELIEETDETLLDVNDLAEDVDFEDTGATSLPTVELEGEDDDDEALTEELIFEDVEELNDADATIAISDDELSLDDDDLELSTEPLETLSLDGGATLVEGEELTLGEDDLDFSAPDLELGGEGDATQAFPAGDTAYDQTQVGGGSGSFVVPSPPPMVSPKIQVQEKIKYVEILPSESWGTRVIAGILLLLVLLPIVGAMIGILEKDESYLGTAGIGFSLYSSSQANNPKTQKLGLRPDKSLSDPDYDNPAHWLLTVNPNDGEAVIAPGMHIVRTYDDGKFPVKGNSAFNDPRFRYTPEQMKEESEIPEDFRRHLLLPTASKNSTPSS